MKKLERRGIELTSLTFDFADLTALEVLQKSVQTLRLLSVILDDDTTASDDFSRVTFPVDLGETGPGTQDFGVRDFDEVDVVLGTKSFDEFDVFGCL